MEYRIPKEFITNDFIKIANEMEELYCRIKWKGDKSYSDFNLYTPVGELTEYLDDGLMEDTEKNQKILDDLMELENKLIDEGQRIANSIIKAKQKIPIILVPDTEEIIDEDLQEDNLRLDNKTIEEKITLYFEHFGRIDISYVENPYLVLEKDIESVDEYEYACLNEDYYEVSIAED